MGASFDDRLGRARLLIVGNGAVSRCTQEVLLRLGVPGTRVTVLDAADSEAASPMARAGARFVMDRLRPDTIDRSYAIHVGGGDVVVDLTTEVGAFDALRAATAAGAAYVNTAFESWETIVDADLPFLDRTLYGFHLRFDRLRAGLRGPTAVVEHGANPGLVSHWVRRALADMALHVGPHDEALLTSVAEGRWADACRLLRVKVVHISERDTQTTVVPRRPGEFACTWSVKGFFEEGGAPAELGWGTHEPALPAGARTWDEGPRHQLMIERPGVDTIVRSWVPTGGPIHGMVVTHGEANTITSALSSYDERGDVLWRPTVHYAYQPPDVAIESWWECRANGWRLQDDRRILADDIDEGIDELGVLLLGDLGGWWCGSQLSIHEARRLVGAGHNATTLQVAASVVAAVAWVAEHPDSGMLVPDELDHETILATADPWLGPCPSIPTSWRPDSADSPFPRKPHPEPFAFGNFLA